MKIKTRNHFITFLMILSLGMLILNALFLGHSIYQKSFTFPQNIPTGHFQNFFITRFNYISVVTAIFVSLIYIFVSLMFIDVEFEKTQSTEILYIGTFLLGCLFEFHRLMFPIANLWSDCSRTTAILSRAITFGRVLSPLSLLFTIIYNNFESRQYVEQNIITLSAVSVFIAVTIPLNTETILPIGLIKFGLGKLIPNLQIFVLAVAGFTMLIKSIQNHYHPKLVIGFNLMLLGYALLIDGNSILTCSAGTICSFTGTFLYLKTLHRQYLWN